MDKREIKVTCDKIEEHLFPVISEFVHSGSKLFWISSHPFFYVMFEQVWSTSEMVHVFYYSGAVTAFISKYCQITYAFSLLHCILFSVELSFMAIKYVSTSFFSCHWKIKSWTLLNTFYFFCTILGHNKLCIFT